MARTRPAVRLTEEGQHFDPDAASTNRWWLFGSAGAGLALVLLAIFLDLVIEVDNILPSVALELGGAALMAAVLFHVERRFVERVGSFECRLASPPSWITRGQGFGGENWHCNHSPSHVWDKDGKWWETLR